MTRRQRRTTPLADRLWAKVNKEGPVPAHRPDLGPCWIFTGHVGRNGYGQILVAGTTKVTAHSAAWRVARGEIPPGYEVCHHCDRRACVRPDHLFVGTRSDNMKDAATKGRGVWPVLAGPANGHWKGGPGVRPCDQKRDAP